MRRKNAFTMIELIVVLVVLGIIAANSIPRLKRDTRTEAINHMLSAIRYTQYLALHDTKHRRDDSRWQKSFWRFQVYKCSANSGLYYMIGTDIDLNRALNRSETAVDPSNGKFTFWNSSIPCPKNNNDALNNDVSPNIFITQKYGINDVNFESCSIYTGQQSSSTAKHIGFDGFGRPHKSFIGRYDYQGAIRPNHWGITRGNCRITFKFEDTSIKPFTIVIENETGYAYVEENPNL